MCWQRSAIGYYTELYEVPSLHTLFKIHFNIIVSYNITLTYLLIPWCRVLLEKLTGFQLVKKLPVFYGIRRFITAFTSARHLSLSCQSTYPHPTSWRSILILSSHLRLGPQLVSFLQFSPPRPCIHLSSLPYVLHARPSNSSRFYHPNNSGWGVQIIKLLILTYLCSP